MYEHRRIKCNLFQHGVYCALQSFPILCMCHFLPLWMNAFYVSCNASGFVSFIKLFLIIMKLQSFVKTMHLQGHSSHHFGQCFHGFKHTFKNVCVIWHVQFWGYRYVCHCSSYMLGKVYYQWCSYEYYVTLLFIASIKHRKWFSYLFISVSQSRNSLHVSAFLCMILFLMYLFSRCMSW